MSEQNEFHTGRQPRFQTTHWSMIVAAGNEQDVSSGDALTELCQHYWKPLYAFVRRSGYQSADAQDLTQAFFERLIDKRFIQTADEGRGRFRTFLLAAMKNFMLNEWTKSTRQKRGGGAVFSLEFADADADAEGHLVIEPTGGETPEAEFHRDWALGLMGRVIGRLEQWYSAKGNLSTFNILRPYLTADSHRLPYQGTADEHEMTVGQVKVNVHRMRGKYRQLLEDEIGGTVGNAELIQDEIRLLFRALQ